MPALCARDTTEHSERNTRCLQAGGGAVKSLAAAAGNGLQYAQQVTIFLCVSFCLCARCMFAPGGSDTEHMIA